MRHPLDQAVLLVQDEHRVCPHVQLALTRLGLALQQLVDHRVKLHQPRILAQIVLGLAQERIAIAIARHDHQLARLLQTVHHFDRVVKRPDRRQIRRERSMHLRDQMIRRKQHRHRALQRQQQLRRACHLEQAGEELVHAQHRLVLAYAVVAQPQQLLGQSLRRRHHLDHLLVARATLATQPLDDLVVASLPLGVLGAGARHHRPHGLLWVGEQHLQNHVLQHHPCILVLLHDARNQLRKHGEPLERLELAAVPLHQDIELRKRVELLRQLGIGGGALLVEVEDLIVGGHIHPDGQHPRQGAVEELGAHLSRSQEGSAHVVALHRHVRKQALVRVLEVSEVVPHLLRVVLLLGGLLVSIQNLVGRVPEGRVLQPRPQQARLGIGISIDPHRPPIRIRALQLDHARPAGIPVLCRLEAADERVERIDQIADCSMRLLLLGEDLDALHKRKRRLVLRCLQCRRIGRLHVTGSASDLGRGDPRFAHLVAATERRSQRCEGRPPQT